VTICGKRYSALVDNQASLNMMSLAFVKNAGLLLYPDNTAFQLSDGSICHAIGRVRTRCALVRASQNGWQSIAHQEFYVLKTAFAPLVLGSPFQQETGFFEPCYHHVSPQKTSRAQLTATRSAHPSCYATWCLKVLLIHQHLAHEAIAMPDSGSSLNLISLAYAMAVGFHLDRSSGAEVPLTIGNGRTVFTLGKVHTTIQLHPSASSLKQARITFLVVKGLVTDVVLGRHFSKKNLLLASRHPNLQWILIERDTPGFLGSSDKGYNPKPMTKKKAG
jgi:hypothetical protein